MLWALWPSQPPHPLVEGQPGAEQVEPAREPEAPRFHYAVLPGREATPAERAWAQVIRREQAKRATEPPPELSRPPVKKGAPALTERVHPGPTVSGLPRAVATRSRPEQLLETLLDPSAEPPIREQAARTLPAAVFERALNDPSLAARASQLAAALTICQDPAAAKALVRLAERDTELAAGAVASAPAGSAAVLGLVGCLDDPFISRRETAASLLAISSDPAIVEALARRLSAPAARREVLIALLSSEAPAAKAVLGRAEAHPQLGAIVHSLRLQGYGPEHRNSQLQMTLL